MAVEGEVPQGAALALDPPPAPETCGWPVVYVDCSGGCDDVWAKWPDGEQDAAKAWFEAQAIDLLWQATGRVFGVCPAVVRPCRSGCGGPSASSTFWGRGPGFDPGFPRLGGATGWRPVILGGQWFNISCGCLSGCSCEIDRSKAIALPGPVVEVTEVRVDGEVVPPSAYRVDHARLLVRTDGGSWPACQNLAAEPTEPDTFEIAYTRGVGVPVGGQVAAGRLACELAKAACDDDECALPERLQTVTRQGITVGVALTGEKWYDTGIWSIDNWINGVVNRPKGFASVRSVDIAPGYRGY